jgi:hypothetical protein
MRVEIRGVIEAFFINASHQECFFYRLAFCEGPAIPSHETTSSSAYTIGNCVFSVHTDLII